MVKTTKNYCVLNGPSHQCKYYSEDRVCLHPNGTNVKCEFMVSEFEEVCRELFEKTRMCRSEKAQVDAQKLNIK